MPTFALDTASPSPSLALVRDDGPVAELWLAPDPGSGRRVLEAAHGLLTAAGLTVRSLDGIVVGVGPGGFTGLRIGIGLSWLAIVAAEMLIGGVGIGFFIWDAWNSSRISDIIVALVYIGVVGFLLDKLIATIGHFVSHGVAAQ